MDITLSELIAELQRALDVVGGDAPVTVDARYEINRVTAVGGRVFIETERKHSPDGDQSFL